MSKCAFCNNKLDLTGYTCRDKKTIDVGLCGDCGLTQLVDFSHIGVSYYQSEDYLPHDIEAVRNSEKHWHQQRLKILLEISPDFRERVVLDYGSGTGGFLLATDGIVKTIYGFDLNKHLCNLHGLRGWKCFNLMDEIPKDVELVTLFHVLEHAKEPWRFLKDIVNTFENCTTIVIEVPNIEEALISEWKKNEYIMNHFGSEHLWYFSKSTLEKVIEKSGCLRIKKSTQLQRYNLSNHIGWLLNGKGGGQDKYGNLNNEQLNYEYGQALIQSGNADSLFIVCDIIR